VENHPRRPAEDQGVAGFEDDFVGSGERSSGIEDKFAGCADRKGDHWDLLFKAFLALFSILERLGIMAAHCGIAHLVESEVAVVGIKVANAYIGLYRRQRVAPYPIRILGAPGNEIFEEIRHWRRRGSIGIGPLHLVGSINWIPVLGRVQSERVSRIGVLTSPRHIILSLRGEVLRSMGV